jgi:Polyphosphate kinase 2 (PPK2)
MTNAPAQEVRQRRQQRRRHAGGVSGLPHQPHVPGDVGLGDPADQELGHQRRVGRPGPLAGPRRGGDADLALAQDVPAHPLPGLRHGQRLREHVLGLEHLHERFLGLVPAWEKAMTDSGIVLLKYWLEVSPEEQTRRLESRIDDPRKVWKLSAMDLKSYSRWYDYSRARDAMFAATDTAWAPWYIAGADDKKRGRLNIISHLLSQVPYKPLAHRDITLPKRQPPGGYVQPDLPLRHIPTPF